MSKQQSGEAVRLAASERNGTDTETSVDDVAPSKALPFGGLSIDFSSDTGVAAPALPAPLPDMAIDFGGSAAVATAPGGPGFVAASDGRPTPSSSSSAPVRPG